MCKHYKVTQTSFEFVIKLKTPVSPTIYFFWNVWYFCQGCGYQQNRVPPPPTERIYLHFCYLCRWQSSLNSVLEHFIQVTECRLSSQPLHVFPLHHTHWWAKHSHHRNISAASPPTRRQSLLTNACPQEKLNRVSPDWWVVSSLKLTVWTRKKVKHFWLSVFWKQQCLEQHQVWGLTRTTSNWVSMNCMNWGAAQGSEITTIG